MRERAQSFESRQNMKNKKYEVFHYKEPKSSAVEVHDHDFYEVYFLLMGDVSYWVEGKTYHLEPGDFLLINPMTLHRPIVSESSPSYERIVLWINKEFLSGFKIGDTSLEKCFIKAMENQNNLLKASSAIAQANLTSLLAKLVRENYGREFGNELYSDGIFLQFMIELNRLSLNISNQVEDNEEQSTLVSRVLEHITNNYTENISLDDLASKFYVSKYYLSHEFSKVVGTSVYRYIMLKRLSVAKQMLFENINANEVCFKCGFKDYTNFYRAFRAEYGISPKELKRSKSN